MSTLLLEAQTFHTARVHELNREHYEPGAISGAGGQDYFDFIKESLPPGRAHRDEKRNYWTSVSRVTALPRALFVTASSGPAGLSGSVVNLETGKHEFEVQPEHATALNGRTLIIVPDRGQQVLAFYERAGGNTSGIELRSALKADWRVKYPNVTLHTSWVQTKDEFLTEADLKGFEVRRHDIDKATDLPEDEVIGTLSWKAVAKRRKVFSKDLREQLLQRPETAHEYFSLDPRDDDETVLDLKLGSMTKRYIIQTGKLPKVALDLGESVADEDFIQACRDRAAEHFGVDWNPNWCSNES